ncbi:MAG: hypothetical protein J3Q66DRAFT_414772 [Benniella sp.]|nr:MAG: hypothetical protein J3Q66DRAFT_414772 [Benniella sp.]
MATQSVSVLGTLPEGKIHITVQSPEIKTQRVLNPEDIVAKFREDTIAFDEDRIAVMHLSSWAVVWTWFVERREAILFMSPAVLHSQIELTLLKAFSYFLELARSNPFEAPIPSSPVMAPAGQTISVHDSDPNDGTLRPSKYLRKLFTYRGREWRQEGLVSRNLPSGFSVTVGDINLAELEFQEFLGEGRTRRVFKAQWPQQMVATKVCIPGLPCRLTGLLKEDRRHYMNYHRDDPITFNGPDAMIQFGRNSTTRSFNCICGYSNGVRGTFREHITTAKNPSKAKQGVKVSPVLHAATVAFLSERDYSADRIKITFLPAPDQEEDEDLDDEGQAPDHPQGPSTVTSRSGSGDSPVVVRGTREYKENKCQDKNRAAGKVRKKAVVDDDEDSRNLDMSNLGVPFAGCGFGFITGFVGLGPGILKPLRQQPVDGPWH